jgi:hypothetical protein
MQAQQPPRGAGAMNIDEFEKHFQPTQRQSKLEPFKEQIFNLREKKYTNLLIREWLKSNGVEVSQEAVRKFIKSRTEKEPESKKNAYAPSPMKSEFKPAQNSKPEASKPQPEETKPPLKNTTQLGNFKIEKPARFKHNPTPDEDLLG